MNSCPLKEALGSDWGGGYILFPYEDKEIPSLMEEFGKLTRLSKQD